MWCSNKFVVYSSYPWYFCLKNLDNISIYPSLVLSIHSDCNFCSSFTRLRSCLVFYNPIQEMQTSEKRPANNILWLMEKLQGLLIKLFIFILDMWWRRTVIIFRPFSLHHQRNQEWKVWKGEGRNGSYSRDVFIPFLISPLRYNFLFAQNLVRSDQDPLNLSKLGAEISIWYWLLGLMVDHFSRFLLKTKKVKYKWLMSVFLPGRQWETSITAIYRKCSKMMMCINYYFVYPKCRKFLYNVQQFFEGRG